LSSPNANEASFSIDDATKTVTLDYYANLVRQDTAGAAGVRPGVYNSAIRYQIAYE
jgi:type 1 fimbria pilin